MQISINGAIADVADGITVGVLIRDRVQGSSRIAVAVNAAVVPRSQWDATRLGPGDSIELLTATAGG